MPDWSACLPPAPPCQPRAASMRKENVGMRNIQAGGAVRNERNHRTDDEVTIRDVPAPRGGRSGGIRRVVLIAQPDSSTHPEWLIAGDCWALSGDLRHRLISDGPPGLRIGNEIRQADAVPTDQKSQTTNVRKSASLRHARLYHDGMTHQNEHWCSGKTRSQPAVSSVLTHCFPAAAGSSVNR
jgi:hypothetical protein